MEDGSWLVTEGDSAIQAIELGNGVILHICRGVQTEGHAQHVIADGERLIKTFGRVVFMVDAVESPKMSTGFREQMTNWFRLHRDHATVNMLIRSKMLEMALNVANLVIGRTAARAFSSVAEWERVGQKELPGFRRRPMVQRPPSISA
jgi:hypothetical protein